METYMIALTVALFATLLVLIAYGLTVLRKRVMHERDFNSSIYSLEQENRLEGLNPEITYIDEYNHSIPEGEETELTFKDLTDIDEIQSGHMIF